MSALARYFNHLGYQVAGYDRTETVLTLELSAEGIEVHYSDLGSEVFRITGNSSNTLVVLTPAVPEEHQEWIWLRNNGYTILKRSEVLGQICNRKRCLAVAGTHGKTTVSTMTATILKNSAIGCGAFLGGISKNYDSNLLLPGENDEWLVTEADEYDRSFLRLTPDIAVITYVDPDHLDIYGDSSGVVETYLQFASQIRKGGNLITRSELAPMFTSAGNLTVFTYSLDQEADFTVRELEINSHTRCYSFQLQTPSGLTPLIKMTYPGRLNVENAIAAGAAAYLAGATPDEISQGLSRYAGVKRRFDILYNDQEITYIDDYAHHPKELSAFIASVRLLYPDRKITGIFQPHLYTRTKDFAEEFAQSLDLLDKAVILPIYPARELPIEGVDSALIVKHMKMEDKTLASRSDIAAIAREAKPGVLLTMGAGDIELMAGDIISALKG